jgi:hypothetical protein
MKKARARLSLLCAYGWGFWTGLKLDVVGFSCL